MSETRLLLDNSAWSYLGTEAPRESAERVAAWITERQVVVCLPFLLEAGYSARSAEDHAELLDRLLALPFVELDSQTERLAIEAQRQLAKIGHHRLPPVDLLLAALAHRHACGVLHRDRHYDLIAERTTLRFENVWLD